MSNEEAIKLIDDRMCFGRGKWSEHHQPVIDEYWQAGEMAIKALQNEPRWIPVTERLPDELAEVNVTWENTEPEPYYDFVKGHCFTGTAVYFCDRWYWYSAVCVDYLREYGFSPNDEMDDAIKVHAWMPLPEPWKGDAK